MKAYANILDAKGAEMGKFRSIIIWGELGASVDVPCPAALSAKASHVAVFNSAENGNEIHRQEVDADGDWLTITCKSEKR